MAAFPTARAHAHLPGQGSVEFILIMPVLLTFLFAIGSFAMLSYQNTVIQHSLATLADALPAGWQEQDRNELVRDLVCDGTDLDKSRLTVTNARVKTETSGAVNDGDSIASDLGASTLRTETRRVAVEAEIAKALGLAGDQPSSTVRLHARDEIADGTLAHGSDLIGQIARVPFVFLAILALGFIAMLVADADAAKREFAVLRAVGATRGQLAARLVRGALRTAFWGIVSGLPVGAAVGWLTSIKTGGVWPGMPHYFAVPWTVVAEGTAGALVFVLLVALPTSLVLIARESRRI